MDEFPALSSVDQQRLFDLISKYTSEKLKAENKELKVIVLGDTNQLTFGENNKTLLPKPGILINRTTSAQNQSANLIGNMNVVPTLTQNFRTNLFAISSFIETFKANNNDLTGTNQKVLSSDPTLSSKDVKGVVSLSNTEFKSKLVSYINANPSGKSRAIIVNDNKIAEYKKLLTDNGIKVIEDPNNNLDKGVYVTDIRNVQGFSFDEVFVDFGKNDPIMFATSGEDYNYNKAMYVATSRAKDLIVVTNFPKFENIKDETITALEDKTKEEIEQSNKAFIPNRDLELKGIKNIIGLDRYRELSKDEEEDDTSSTEEEPITNTQEEEEDIVDDEKAEEETEKLEQTEEPAPTPTTPAKPVEPEDEPIVDDGVVIDDTGTTEEQVISDKVDKTSFTKTLKNIYDKVNKDITSLKDGIVRLLFPTASTIKYKIEDGIFSVKAENEFKNRDLRDGDKVQVIPFKTSNSKVGFAFVTPALDEQGNEISKSFRTVGILSDKELAALSKSNRVLYNSLNGYLLSGRTPTITYADVNNRNGIIEKGNKFIDPISEGTVIHNNPVSYFFKKDSYTSLNKKELKDIISKFVKGYYKNYLDSLDPTVRTKTERDILDFYVRDNNARIIIAKSQKQIDKLNVPEEYNMKPGRPYIIFLPFGQNSNTQVIALSRRVLNINDHSDLIDPIIKFIKDGKKLRKMFKNYGITGGIGYDKDISNFMLEIAKQYHDDNAKTQYKPTKGKYKNEAIVLTNSEAELISEMYQSYKNIDISRKTANTLAQLRKINSRIREYTLSGGETIVGSLFDIKDDGSFKIKLKKTKEQIDKNEEAEIRSFDSQSLTYNDEAMDGNIQRIMNNIMKSNSGFAFDNTRYTLGDDPQIHTGFANENRTAHTDTGKTYDFMSLFGTKKAPVKKTISENYEDVFDILENLFTFDTNGDMKSKLRVPVPVFKEGFGNEESIDYSNSRTDNTTHTNDLANKRYFEHNFDDVLGSQVYVDFANNAVTVSSEEEGSVGVGGDVDLSATKKYTINKADNSLPQAPEISKENIDWEASGLEDTGVAKIKLIETRGRNNDGQNVGTVRVWNQDGTIANFEVKFKEKSTPKGNTSNVGEGSGGVGGDVGSISNKKLNSKEGEINTGNIEVVKNIPNVNKVIGKDKNGNDIKVVINGDKLKGTLLSKNGNYLFKAMQGRVFTLAKVGDFYLPFYISSAGTSGKIAGEWYPFFGYNNWLVKGRVGTKGEMEYSQKISDIQKLLNDNFILPARYLSADNKVAIGEQFVPAKDAKGNIIREGKYNFEKMIPNENRKVLYDLSEDIDIITHHHQEQKKETKLNEHDWVAEKTGLNPKNVVNDGGNSADNWINDIIALTENAEQASKGVIKKVEQSLKETTKAEAVDELVKQSKPTEVETIEDLLGTIAPISSSEQENELEIVLKDKTSISDRDKEYYRTIYPSLPDTDKKALLEEIKNCK